MQESCFWRRVPSVRLQPLPSFYFFFFWPCGSCRATHRQQGTESGPTVGYRIAWQLGQLLGFEVNALQSPRADSLVSTSQWRPQEDKQFGTFLTRTYRGEMNIATFQKKRFELKGITQLYSTNQNMWNVLYLNC